MTSDEECRLFCRGVLHINKKNSEKKEDDDSRIWSIFSDFTFYNMAT